MRPIGDKLVIATHNPGKLREIAALIEPLGIACVGAEELGLPEPEEIGNTFADNADLKAREAADLSRAAGARRRQRPVRRCAARPAGHFLGALGRGRGRQARLDAGDGEASGAKSRRPSPTPARRAFRLRAGDRLAQRRPDRDVRGRVDGTLVWPPRGDRGFGYDPMFVPVGHEQTFGELDPRAEARDQPPRGRLPQARGGAERMSGEPLALYVHWPFCVSKCPYCDFNSHVRATIDQDAWREALLADLAHEARLLPGRRLTSIFFGGGTPSLMDPRDRRSGDRRRDARIGRPPTTSKSRSRPIPIRSKPRASPTSRRQASTACRSGCRASTMRPSRFLGRAHSAREGLARAGDRAAAIRAGSAST